MAYTNPAIQAAIKFKSTATRGDESRGDANLPVKGKAMVVFTEYVEIGIHSYSFAGTMRHPVKARLTFELTGKNYPHKVSADGIGRPQTIVIEENIERLEDSTFGDLFNKMKKANDGISHIAELLGQHYIIDVNHGSGAKPWGGFKNGKSYDITLPISVDMATGDTRAYPCPAHGTIKCFIWGHPRKEDWDAIFIPGSYAGKSLNKIQEKMMAASNFKGSPLEEMLNNKQEEEDSELFAVVDSTALDSDGNRKPLLDDSPWGEFE